MQLLPRFILTLLSFVALANAASAARYRTTHYQHSIPATCDSPKYRKHTVTNPANSGIYQVVQIHYFGPYIDEYPSTGVSRIDGPRYLEEVRLEPGDSVDIWAAQGNRNQYSFYNGAWNITGQVRGNNYDEMYTMGASGPVNRAPSASISGSSSLAVGQTGSWTFSASDDDGNLSQWRFRASTNTGAGWSNTSGSPSGSHSQSFSAAGTYYWVIEAKDSNGLTASDQIRVDVYNPTPSFTLTTNVSPSGAGSVTGGGSYDGGQTASISASAASGWRFTGWTGAASGTGSSTTVLMNDNKSVTANFEAIPVTYTLSTNVSPAGAGSVSGGGSKTANTSASVSASAASGYTFSHWSGDASGSSTSASVYMNGNKSVTANFTANPTSPSTYTLSTNVSPAGAGSVSGGGSKTANSNASVSASAASGYTFSHWSGDASGSSASASVYMNGNKSVTANFTSSGGSTNYTVSTSVSPAGSGSVSGGGSYSSGASASLRATPNSGYSFSHWTGGTSGTSNPRSVTVNGNISVTANFVADTPTTYTVSTAVSPAGAGSVSGGGSYTANDVATVTASANAGYVFSGWSGDLSGSANPGGLIVSSNKSVTANFTADTPTGADGTITATPATVVEGSPVVVTWTTTGAASATISGPSVSASDLSGSRTVTLPVGTHTFTLTGYTAPLAPTAPVTMTSSSYVAGTSYALRITGSTSGTVWGSSPYTADSALSAAAVHSGLVAPGETKTINVNVRIGSSSYSSSTRNGFTTTSWGSYGKAYTLSLASAAEAAFTRQATVTVTEAPNDIMVAFDLPTEILRPTSGSVYQSVTFNASGARGRLKEYQWSATNGSANFHDTTAWTPFSTHTEQGRWIPQQWNPGYYTMNTRYDSTKIDEWNAYVAQGLHNEVGYGYYAMTDPDGVEHTSQIFYTFEDWRYTEGYYTGGYYETTTVTDLVAAGSATKSLRVRSTTALGPITVSFTARDADGKTANLTKVMNVVDSLAPVTLTVTKVGDGQVTGAGNYQPGQTATITATPDTGWRLAGITGDVTSSSSPATVLMDRNKEATVTFVLDSFVLTTGVFGPGQVTPGGMYAAPNPTVTNVTVTATPTPTSRFTSFTGDVDGTTTSNWPDGTASLIVPMDRSRSVIANFTGKLPQEIQWAHPGTQVAGGTLLVNAVATSGLPVSVTILDGADIASYSGASRMMTFSAPGQVTLRLDQAGNETYLPAESRTYVIDVTAFLRATVTDESAVQINKSGEREGGQGVTNTVTLPTDED